jgi:hypothetical protein
MRKFARHDGNHSAITDLLRRAGASVFDTASLGNGFPDIAVGYRGRTDLVEIKVGNKKLTPDEIDFGIDWRGRRVLIMRSVEDAINFLNKKDID